MGQQNGIAHPVRQIIEAAQLVSHGMHVAEARIVEGHPGQVLGIGHVVAGNHVGAVGHGRAQVLRNQLDRHQGAGVGDRRGDDRNISFYGVGQSIHTRCGGECRGHAGHQQRIIDGDRGLARDPERRHQ